MGYKCTFMDNDIYYAKDVNAMFANLTSDGVALRDSGNLLSDLNEAVSETTSQGVQNFLDSCKLTLSDGIYKIGEGVCFMPDGSAITFDKDGYEVSITEGVKNYVYLKRNDTMNTIDIITSTEAGGSGTVPIAEIEADGTIYDTRKYSRAKVKIDQPAQIEKFSTEFEGNSSTSQTIVVDVGRSDFSRIIINKFSFVSYSSGGMFFPTYHNVADISEGEEVIFYMHKAINYNSAFEIHILKRGNTLEFTVVKTSTGCTYTLDFEIIS